MKEEIEEAVMNRVDESFKKRGEKNHLSDFGPITFSQSWERNNSKSHLKDFAKKTTVTCPGTFRSQD